MSGLKLMKEGETITFLFPSYKAYGYYGIENKLGTNIPIQCTVTLNSINKTNEKLLRIMKKRSIFNFNP